MELFFLRSSSHFLLVYELLVRKLEESLWKKKILQILAENFKRELKKLHINTHSRSKN